jgi:hypothetical protein
MAIFLSSRLALTLLAQTPAAAQTMPRPPDTVAVLWARVHADSQDARAWFALSRIYLAREALDTADDALSRVAALDEGAMGDSARALRVFAWGRRAMLAWRSTGAEAAGRTWARIPDGARLPAELEELGENLLRACPERGVLLTARAVDTHAASYLRFRRGLRPDLTILPLDAWRTDSALRARVTEELGLSAERPDPDERLRALEARRPLCASMAFERPPLRGRWSPRQLVWVTGRVGRERVSPDDFVFAALRVALDESATWADEPLAIYRRAVQVTRGLCRSLKTFGIAGEAGCR